MVRFIRLIGTMILASLLLGNLGGCSPSAGPKSGTVGNAGTGALTDGDAINSVGDGDVLESAGLNSQVNSSIEEDRRYEYRSGR